MAVPKCLRCWIRSFRKNEVLFWGRDLAIAASSMIRWTFVTNPILRDPLILLNILFYLCTDAYYHIPLGSLIADRLYHSSYSRNVLRFFTAHAIRNISHYALPGCHRFIEACSLSLKQISKLSQKITSWHFIPFDGKKYRRTQCMFDNKYSNFTIYVANSTTSIWLKRSMLPLTALATVSYHLLTQNRTYRKTFWYYLLWRISASMFCAKYYFSSTS